jgi:hypothetical protein
VHLLSYLLIVKVRFWVFLGKGSWEQQRGSNPDILPSGTRQFKPIGSVHPWTAALSFEL